MTVEDLKDKLNRADDMLAALSNQRNAALNECINLAADLADTKRQIESLRSQLKEKTP